jgi:putative FmdB family regulatory protein
MPTYEYRCGACGHEFERFQAMTASSVTKCPSCGKRKVRRLIGSGGALIFKGSGFYATDYRSASYKEGAKKDGPPAAKSDTAAAAPTSPKEAGAAACDTCKKDPKSCPREKKK